MNTTFIMDGGAGRLVTAVPALEKYAMLNPDDQFVVLTAGWESVYWCHPLLQPRTFNVSQKGVFDIHIKNNRLIHPEPYMLHGYYNQNLHITQAFDKEINQTDDHSDLDQPNLYVSQNERRRVTNILCELRRKHNKHRVIVVQPYGSGMCIQQGRPTDPTHRSLDVDFYLQLVHQLSKNNIVIYFGEQDYFHPGDSFSINFFDAQPDLRLYMTLIAECDYFIGVDSVGQHMARSFNKPGMVILGSTFAQNISYESHFGIYRNKFTPTYVPIRTSGMDCEFANNLNENVMQFDDHDLLRILEIANER